MAAESTECKSLPRLLSSFIDAFVDFSVSGGLFLPNNPNPNPYNNSMPVITRLPSPTRLIAVGDLHGDLPKSLSALSLASLIHPSSLRWSAGPTTALLIGDYLDRGSDEIRLLYLLHRLKLESHGQLITLLGNHEIMNIESDFRYITPQSLADFSNWAFWFKTGISMKNLSPQIPNPPNPFEGIPKSFPGVQPQFWPGIRARIAALRPSGPISTRFLADNPVVVVVGDSVFVHGGLTQSHIQYGLERINEEVRDWIRGFRGRFSPSYMRGRESLVWLRRFSEGMDCDCESLGRVLDMIPGVRRMIMGHTIQKDGINGVCEDRAIRIDVGLSKGCGNGLPEVLEISNGGKELRIVTANVMYDKRRENVTEEVKDGVGLLMKEQGRIRQVESKA